MAGRPWQAARTMTQEQFDGIVRHVLGALGAFVIAKGLADESLVLQASGALGTLAAVVWSVIDKLKR